MHPEIVERRVGPVTKDLLGFIDVLGFGRQGRLIGLQVTSGSHHAHRVRKVMSMPDRVGTFLAIPGSSVCVLSWSQLKRTGWTPRITAWSHVGRCPEDVCGMQACENYLCGEGSIE
ncbi:MAG: hypothetical protein D6746_14785 [Bacteroidetes bacterium]|nr:MAG: hypothetical protein D6746_14785 [Bacteroidota bacterium]